MVLQDYTQFAGMNIVYFDKNYIIEVQEHITNWNSQLHHTCDLQNQGFRRSLLQTSGTSRLYLTCSYEYSLCQCNDLTISLISCRWGTGERTHSSRFLWWMRYVPIARDSVQMPDMSELRSLLWMQTDGNTLETWAGWTLAAIFRRYTLRLDWSVLSLS